MKFEKYLVETGYKREYEKYLISKGLKKDTTIKDYIARIERICKIEGLTWSELAKDVKSILPEYEKNGVNEFYGQLSHEAPLNALRHFERFIELVRWMQK